MIFLNNKVERTKNFIKTLKTHDIKHVHGGSLYDHCVRVQKIIEHWGLSESVQLAALCHSLYSTEYFPVKVLEIEKREVLQKIIGIEAEKLAHYFCILNRECVFFNLNTQMYEIENIYTKEKSKVPKKEGEALVHIMLANDIDHLTIDNLGRSLTFYNKYVKLRQGLCLQACQQLDTLLSSCTINDHTDVAKVRFIAHSGVLIQSNKVTVVVDPWIYDSRRNKPTIQGFDPTQHTIDYLIPESKTSAKELSPDIVCFSHFHTHHSPLQEVIDFLKEKPLIIFCPKLEKNKLDLIRQKIGQYLFERITFNFLEKDEEFIVKGVTVKAFLHQDGMPHFMYFVRINDTSIMHIVDAEANKNKTLKIIDSSWDRVSGLSPSYLFIGCVGHILKKMENGERDLIESATLSPVQAARISIKIGAKMVIPIGMYNHSVWDDRYEMGLNSGEAEAQFYWAISYLAPAIRFRKAYPGEFLN